VSPRKDHRSVDLISDALPFGRLWWGEPHAVIDAIGYVKHYSRLQLAVIRVDDDKSGRANTKNSNHRRARHVLRQQDDSLLSALSRKIVVLATCSRRMSTRGL